MPSPTSVVNTMPLLPPQHMVATSTTKALVPHRLLHQYSIAIQTQQSLM